MCTCEGSGIRSIKYLGTTWSKKVNAVKNNNDLFIIVPFSDFLINISCKKNNVICLFKGNYDLWPDNVISSRGY